MKKLQRSLLTYCMIICCIATSILPTHASSVLSTTSQATVYGRTYNYHASLSATTDSLIGIVSVSSSETIPIGYMGCQVQIFSATEPGHFVTISDMRYNSTACPAMSSLVQLTDVSQSDGYFYSIGYVELFNGNGYSELTTTRTPNIAVTSTLARNALDSVPALGQSPTASTADHGLLPAIGQSGICGFIKVEDIARPNISSPEEAIAYMENLPAQRTIPLYDSDGVTVIDSFLIINE